MSYFTLAGVPIRVKTPSTILDYLKGVSVEPLIGAYGSNTTYLGIGGKTLDLQIEVRDYDDVETIRQLANNREVVPLVSPAIVGYNVLWHTLSFVQHDHSTPENPNHFKHKISLQQHSEFNVTQQNFTNWKVQKRR